ncbi:hypothetical protein AGMMS50243_28360 [Betaproteobacteria bacterium]|nr:hypothetical protein AGMMS50243_28360 [Betaproteobacteria bacterium]
MDAGLQHAGILEHQPAYLAEKEIFTVFRTQAHELVMFDAFFGGVALQAEAADRLVEQFPGLTFEAKALGFYAHVGEIALVGASGLESRQPTTPLCPELS